MSSLRVGIAQLPSVFGDVTASLARLEGLLVGKSVDLVVLPELALTGYASATGSFDVRPYAEGLDGPTAATISAMAAKQGAAIVAPLVERVGERFYNSLLFFDETGCRIGHWRKRHPWYPETWASPGDLGSPILQWRGVSICAAICFDLHFLEEDAAQSLQAADILLFSSAWVEQGDSRRRVLSALAKRWRLSVVNANWGAGLPAVSSQGASMIFNTEGRVLSETKQQSALAWCEARLNVGG